MANSIGDWFKRYWVWVTLVIVGLVAFLLFVLFPTDEKKAPKILKEAEEKARKLKEAKAYELAAIDKELEDNIIDLIEIKSIQDKDERMKQLAEFANKRRKK